MSYWAAVASIKAANLRAPTYRTARELLDLAAETGQLKISKSGLMELCQTDAEGTMRRQLGELQKAGIIHFSTNQVVHISFVDYPTADGVITTRASTITTCAPVITTRANAGQDDAADDDSEPYEGDGVITTRAPTITTCAPVITTRALPHTRGVGWLVDPDRNQSSESNNQQTNKHAPTSDVVEEPLSADQVRAVALLTDADVGISPRQARQLAAEHSLDYIVRQVFEWRRQVDAGIARDTGALITRFRKRFSAVLIPSDRASPLWQRHMPDDGRDEYGETEEDRRRKYIPDQYSDIILG